MKINKITIMALVLGLTSLTSCSDFLDRQPTNSGNADEAIATQRDAEVAINLSLIHI